MRSIALLSCVSLSWVVSCGTDESLSPPKSSLPDAAASVDPCGALDALLGVAGAPERLCALNQGAPSAESVQQCQLCAAAATAAEALFPNPTCPTQLEDCPVDDVELRECFQTVGQILTEALPGCTRTQEPALDPSILALRIGASSCAPVLLECPPLRDLVLGLVGASF